MTDPRITKEMIEALAKATFEPSSLGDGGYTWAEMVRDDPSRADLWRDDARAALEAVFALLPEPDSSNWRYFTQLDGDYAEESATAAQAEHVRREAFGRIPPHERRIWRERTQSQEVAVLHPVPDTNEGAPHGTE